MAYTKYSLTPANNTATPPDGAPEGMLPSAVNDTMRDMMAQIRDCGDGIRDGTYTMTAAKITGGTITGVTFTGNTFSNPTITGVSTFAAGTVSAPAITTTGDTNTGIYFPAADTIAFTEGGVESMRIDSSGNVGIGNASAVGKLEVYQNNNSGVPAIYARQDGTAPIQTWNVAAGTERMRIDSSGRVGIGTSSPVEKLQSSNGVAATGANQSVGSLDGFVADYSSGISRMFASRNGVAAGTMAFWTTDSTGTAAERMRIDSSGFVGIGTSSPSSRLTISYGGYQTNGFALSIGANIGDNTARTNATAKLGMIVCPHYTNAEKPLGLMYGYSTSTDNEITFGSGVENATAATRILFYTAANNTTAVGTERMRITSGGDLLVGTTGLGTIGSSNGSQLAAGGAIYSASTGDSVFSRRSSDGTVITFRKDTTSVGSISVTGSATAYNTSSDHRLKENIAPMTGALAKVAQLKPCTYTWKATGEAGQGFIAHELQEVVPDAVTGEKDAVDEEGNPKYQGVDTSFLVATLTAAIQEQQAMIEELKQEVAALKAK